MEDLRLMENQFGFCKQKFSASKFVNFCHVGNSADNLIFPKDSDQIHNKFCQESLTRWKREILDNIYSVCSSYEKAKILYWELLGTDNMKQDFRI